MSFKTRLLAVTAIVIFQLVTFFGCLTAVVPAMRSIGIQGEWPANFAGGILILFVAPALALIAVGKLRGFDLQWRPLLVIAGGDSVLTALLLRLPSEVTGLKALSFVSITILGIIAVPVLSTFFVRHSNTSLERPVAADVRYHTEC